MPVVPGGGPVAPLTESGWVVTDGITNIVVGVKGGMHEVEFNLGDDAVVYQGGSNYGGAVLIAKAAAVRVSNKSADVTISFEVFE